MEDDTDGDRLNLYGVEFSSRLLAGTAQYPSPAILSRAIVEAKAEIVTVSLRRESGGGRAGERFWALIRDLGVRVMPNTAGCLSVKEAVTTAQMAREVFDTAVDQARSHRRGRHSAARCLRALSRRRQFSPAKGFRFFLIPPRILSAAEKLLAAGCEVLMPWGSPIGSGRGLNNPYALKSLRAHFPDVPLIIDAGIGAPSHAAAAMEMGFDAVLTNTAIAKAGDPVKMARAFALAVEAGRIGYRCRSDASARHGGTLDPGDRARVQRSCACLTLSI